MTNKKSTKKALLMSVLSLLLCFSMLVGTTFAWFTDSVESGRNIIAAGHLDVELNHADKGTNNALTEVNGGTTLFDDIELWEPGAVVYETLQVVNAGTLALKYNLTLNVLSETVTPEGYKLSDVIMVGVIDGALGAGTTREGLVNAVSEWTSLSAFALKRNGVKLDVGGEDTVTVVLYWQPNTNEIDNKYNLADKALNLEIGVTLTATQVEAEFDSFGDNYDAGAKVPNSSTTTSYTTANSDGSATLTVMDAPSVESKRTTIEAPAGAFQAADKVEVEVTTTNALFNVNAEGSVVAALDVTLSVNGKETSEELDAGAYTVTTYISKGLTDVTVAYTGTDGRAQPTDVTYDPETGKLTFKTTHFSEYAVSGKALAYDAVNDTAVNDVEEIVEAAKDSTTTVVIPEENKQTVSEKIEEAVTNGTITEDDADVINNALVYVAKIGDVNYSTAAEFVKACATVADGTVITLLQDIEVIDNPFVISAKNVTFDLNGKTINGVATTSTTSYLFKINTGAEVAIKNGTVSFYATKPDTNWVSGGQPPFPGYANNTISTSGKLVIENATIENLTAKGGASYAIDCYYGADLVVNSGKIDGLDKNAIRMFVGSASVATKVTINGGVVTGSRAVWIHLPSSNAAVAPLAELVVNGGTLTSNDSDYNLAIYSYSYGNDASATTVELNGGTINGNVAVGGGTKNGREVVTVGNCTINGDVYRYTSGATEYIYSDGNVDSADELAAALAAGTNVTLVGDVDLGEKTVTIPADVNATLNLNGYNITAAQSGTTTYGTFNVAAGATLTVEGEGNVTLTTDVTSGISAAIFQNDGTLNIYGGNYEANQAASVSGLQAVIAVIDNCPYNSVAEVNIHGGTFAVTGLGAINIIRNWPIHADGVATLNVYGGYFKANPDVSTTYLWNKDDSTPATLNSYMNFYGGTFDTNVVYEDYNGQEDIYIAEGVTIKGYEYNN